MKASPTSSDDPFAGLPPTPIRCSWLSEQDEALAASAEIVRLVVDDDRWGQHFVNEVYQRTVLRDVADFLGPNKAVLVTPAGMITTSIGWPDATLSALTSCFQIIQTSVNQLVMTSSKQGVLLGVDGCIPGQATPLQTVVHLNGRSKITAANTTVKIYPAPGDERQALLGWRICDVMQEIPSPLKQARCVQTQVGPMLVLVCFDAGLFSPRSLANLQDPLKLQIREHFLQKAKEPPKPRYIVIATHCLDSRSGQSFINAAEYLEAQTGATVVTTTFAPGKELERVGQRFPVRGIRTNKVATLLIETQAKGKL